jgi:hypothetical protein
MRRLRLLIPMQVPEGVLRPGTEMVVDEAEARLLRGAIGLVEDLGEAEPPAPPAPATGGEPPAPDAAGAGPETSDRPAAGDAGGVAGTNPEGEGAALESAAPSASAAPPAEAPAPTPPAPAPAPPRPRRRAG